MSVGITLHCNKQWQHGSCATSLTTGAHTVDDALAAGRRQGWRTHSDGRDYCPAHSGRRPPQITGPVIQLRPDQAPDAPPASDRSEALTSPGAAVGVVRTASAHLKALATVTDTEVAANTHWHSQLVAREHWFGHGIDNAVGGPAGRLAGLLSPANARFVAQLLDRTVTSTPGQPVPLPAEAFLLANNIVRSTNR